MLLIDDAIKKLCNIIQPIHEAESIDLLNANQRVLSRSIIAPIDVPPSDNSAMDGYAIRVEDLQTHTTLPISQTICAGDSATEPLAPNTAARIFTGANIPIDANAVVMQEHCEVSSNQVSFTKSVKLFNNIRKQGQDVSRGEFVLKKNRQLQAQDLGLLASLGITSVSVYRKPKVAIISTGNEIIEPGTPLSSGKIYNTNRYLLHGLLQTMGLEVIDIGHVADDLQATIDALNTAAKSADCIISSGGVSVGDEDYVKTALDELGKLSFWKLAIKPGKPVAFGYIHSAQKRTPFIGLPGNPASVFVTFLVVARALLLKLQHLPVIPINGTSMPANFSWAGNNQRQEYLRAKINNRGWVEIHPNQNSGVLSSSSWAEGFVIVLPKQRIDVGCHVEFVNFKMLY